MNLKTRYVVKGIGKEQIISSVVNIYHEQGKITKVEDKWDGKLPESSIANVSFIQLLNPLWWAFYMWAWLFWVWSFVWWSRAWRVRTAFPLTPATCTKSCLLSNANSSGFTGFPPSQLGHSAQDDQRAQEQGGGCAERQLDTLDIHARDETFNGRKANIILHCFVRGQQ